MANPVQLPKVVPIRNTGGDEGKTVAVDIPVKMATEKGKGVQNSIFEFQSQESRMRDIRGISKGVVAVKPSGGSRDLVNVKFLNNQEACVGKRVDSENGLQQSQYDNIKNGMGSKIGPDSGLNGMDVDVGSNNSKNIALEAVSLVSNRNGPGHYKGNTGGSAGQTSGDSGNYVGHSKGNAGGNLGSFNGHSNGKQVANGKHVGSGGSYGKKFGTAAEGRGMGKSFTAGSTAKAKNASMSAVPTASTSSGSRFEILREEEGVILSTTVTQDITQAEAERSKKISKKGKKPVAIVGPLEVNHKGVEFYKKSFGLDKASNSNPNPCQLDSEVLDNAAALRQLHREVSKFDGTSSDIRGGESLLSDRGEVEPPVETFDKFAETKSLKLGKWVHLHLKLTGRKRPETLVSNHLINMYFSCDSDVSAREVFDKMSVRNLYSYNGMLSGYAKMGRMRPARKLFDQMPERDVVSWNSMIIVYAKSGVFDESLMFYKELRRLCIGYNEFSFSGALTVCVKLKELKLMRQVHGQVLVIGFLSNLVISSTLVDAYARCGEMNDARRMFNEMQVRDVLAWTTLVLGYAKSGDMESASELFNEMPEKDPVSWTALIAGYARNGLGDKALELLRKMMVLCIRPDQFTFSSSLCTCSSLASPLCLF
ncbi:hypothetical protein LWI29_019095 [Acer saccharum]|uniref:Pentatricopeptide repeat-containing protein n=1 Tax=Acer saccharum TaxID=4024 RepID=A0AA39RZ57_ACESA|nr:hypothetical protein LWI29_019095 [Acer saccharum]